MTDYNDFRQSLDDYEDENDSEFPVDFDALTAAQVEPREPFLGLGAGERAFLSFMLFLNVLVIGVGLLIATGRIVF